MADKREECLRSILALKATRGRLPTKPATLILQTIYEDDAALASRATKSQLINPVLFSFLLPIGGTKRTAKSIKRFNQIFLTISIRTSQSL